MSLRTEIVRQIQKLFSIWAKMDTTALEYILSIEISQLQYVVP